MHRIADIAGMTFLFAIDVTRSKPKRSLAIALTPSHVPTLHFIMQSIHLRFRKC